MDWKKLIENGELEICSTTQAKAREVYPNRIGWLKQDPQVGALVVYQSETDFAIGRAGIDYITNALQQDRIKEGFVVLLRGGDQPKFVAAATPAEIECAVRGLPIQNGKWGAFWWYNAEAFDAGIPF
ncbi:MAG TPA: hypothetical protein VHT68_11030 [Pseudolabrys sp.]|nr:hypothetical protein [Pseudolabrys sp.]